MTAGIQGNPLPMTAETQSEFDEIIPRRGTRSYKWDTAGGGADDDTHADRADDVLPLWVADMDFRTAPPVVDALRRRVEHGIFGYTRVPDAYYEAVINWFARRHHWQIAREWIIYTTGVVPALSAIIRALTTAGDRVLVQTPVYNCFFSSIRNNGCEAVEIPLLYKGGIARTGSGTLKHEAIPTGFTYHIDFAALECEAAHPRVKLLLLCNPHNPVGRVWTRQELLRIGEICLRHDVTVVSDEIHCELIYPGHRHTPFASLSDAFRTNSVTCTSPSKAFNLAGLQIANIICADPSMRRRIDKAINIHEVCDVNPFGVEALIAAYNDGEAWLDALVEYLHGNYCLLCEHFAEHLPTFPVARLEATYLAWVDCRVLQQPSQELVARLLTSEKVWVNEGNIYGEAGEGFIRINIACPRAILREGLRRLTKGAAHL